MRTTMITMHGLLLFFFLSTATQASPALAPVKTKAERIAIIGSSLSMGFPHDLSWVDGFEAYSEKKGIQIRKWLSHDMSSHKALSLIHQIKAFSPQIIIFQISPADGLLEEYRSQGELLPIYQNYHSGELKKTWMNRTPVPFPKKQWEKELSTLTQRGIRCFVIGPASWKWNLPPLGSHPSDVSDQTLASECNAIESLGKENEKISPQYALKCYQRLTTLMPRNAQYHWLLSQQMVNMNLFKEIRPVYQAIAENDTFPLRGNTAFYEELRTATEQAGATYFDLQLFLDRASPRNMAGNELFLDPIHPRMIVHKRLLEAILKQFFKVNINEQEQKLDLYVSPPAMIRTANVMIKCGLYHMADQILNHLMQQSSTDETLAKTVPLLEMVMDLSHHLTRPGPCFVASDQLIQMSPYHERAWILPIRLAAEAGQWLALNERLKVMPSVHWNVPHVLWAQGLEAWHAQKMNLAELFLSEAHRLNSDNMKFKKSIFQLLFELGKVNQCEEFLKKIHLKESEQLWFQQCCQRWLTRHWNQLTPTSIIFKKLVPFSAQYPHNLSLQILHIFYLWRLEQWIPLSKQTLQLKRFCEKNNRPINLKLLDQALLAAKKKTPLSMDTITSAYPQ